MNTIELKLSGSSGEDADALMRLATAAGLKVESDTPIMNSVDASTQALIIVVLGTVQALANVLNTWLKQRDNRRLEALRPGVHITLDNLCSEKDVENVLGMNIMAFYKSGRGALPEAPKGVDTAIAGSFSVPKAELPKKAGSEIAGSMAPPKSGDDRTSQK